MIKLCLLLCTLAIAVNGAAIEKIIGSHDAPNHKHPYQVSFRERIKDHDDVHFCSGSIINLKWLVTAAHCFHNRSISNVVAVAGTNHLNEKDYSYEVDSYVIHRAYVDFKYNDICLVRVKKNIRFSYIIQPIRLPDDDLPSGYLNAVFSGWGSAQSDNSSHNKLQEIDLQIIPNDVCVQTWPIDENHVCTLNEGKGICHGGDGGPLVFDGYLVGIASYVSPCAPSNPDVYTRVWPYIPWIQRKMMEHKNLA